MSESQYTINDLLYLMERLRDPETGCPWDRKQTNKTILPYTLEEAYEVADAIEQEDHQHLKEELGDLLFQVIFYAQMGREENHFDFEEIVSTLVAKLVRRHPHVFPDGTLQSNNKDNPISEAEIKGRWETIKKQEREEKAAAHPEKANEPVSILDDIPNALPALNRAEKLQKRAAGVGFDWPEAIQVLDKIEEEIAELREEIQQGNQEKIKDEMGDLLFACVNLARHLKVPSDAALRLTNLKFERRFHYIESKLNLQGKSFDDVTLDEMDTLWNEAKTLEKS